MRLLTPNNIDFGKWDAAVKRTKDKNPVYAYFWYLTCTCSKRWYGLIFGNYESIVPVPSKWSLKFFKASLRPPYSQQLGVFGTPLKQAQRLQVMEHIQGAHHTVDYPFSVMPEDKGQLTFRSRINMEIDLSHSYEAIYTKYSKSLKRRLKTLKDGIELRKSVDVEAHIQFYLNSLRDKVDFSQKAITSLRCIIYNSFRRNKGIIVEAYARESGAKLGSAFFLVDDHYITNLAGASNIEGRKSFAMHAMVDYVNRTYSNQDKVLDMEGSDIPGIQSFFSSFGAVKKTYFQWQIRRPMLNFIWPLKV